MALATASDRLVLRHRTFVGPTVCWNFKPLNANRERIRAQAEAFASEIGVEKVVSVAEHAMSFGPFSVVVWYRAAPDAEPGAASDGGAG